MDFVGLLGRTKGHSMQTQEVGQRMRGGGCAVSLGVKPACSVLDVQFSESVIMVQLNLFCLPKKGKKFD